MDWQQLCEDSHRIAKDKGWLDKPRSWQGTIALIHSELSEALEDYRNGRPPTEIYYEAKFKEADGSTTKEIVSSKDIDAARRVEGKYGRGRDFLDAKPCGIPIELADVLIRIAQHCGTEGWDLKTVLTNMVESYTLCDGSRLSDFEWVCAHAHRSLSEALVPSAAPVVVGLAECAWLVVRFANAVGIDLEQAVAIKATYNAQRPYRHGGKVI